MTIPLRILALVTITAVAAMALARRENSGAWIAFASDRDGVRSIYLMTGDGGHQRRISDALTCAISPQWSADGRWIVFSNPCAVPQDLLRIRLGGGSLQAISSIPSFTNNTRWSPDRQQVVVMRNPSSLYILRVDGGGERYLAADYYFPQWSPDGGWIYARPLFSDESGLDRIHVRTGAVQSLLPPDTAFTDPGWSPDAQHLILAMPTDHGDELFTMNPDGGNLTMISADLPESRISEPHWSPDGAWIVFLGGLSLYRIRPDGGGLARLSEPLSAVENLQWSQDSRWLLFSADDGGKSGIFRLRADGSSMERLAAGSSPQYAPVSGLGWHPLWWIIVAVGVFLASLVWRFRASKARCENGVPSGW